LIVLVNSSSRLSRRALPGRPAAVACRRIQTHMRCFAALPTTVRQEQGNTW
jgi:hypothetical protein